MLGRIKRKIASRLDFLNLSRTVQKVAAPLVAKSGTKLFLDCGSNVGQGYSFFSKHFVPEQYDAILIEPNPSCMKALRERFASYPNLEFIEAAVWVRNEKLKLFGLVEDDRGETSQGASHELESQAGRPPAGRQLQDPAPEDSRLRARAELRAFSGRWKSC